MTFFVYKTPFHPWIFLTRFFHVSVSQNASSRNFAHMLEDGYIYASQKSDLQVKWRWLFSSAFVFVVGDTCLSRFSERNAPAK